MKKIVVLLAIGFLVCTFLGKKEFFFPHSSVLETTKTAQAKNTQSITEDAFARKLSNVQVAGTGQVVKIFSDDLKGRKHQKFLLQVAPNQTILVAHNIDIAPRIDSLHIGDSIKYYGEYEWNSKGGVVHWTHRDPQGRHVDGWLIHEGIRYE